MLFINLFSFLVLQKFYSGLEAVALDLDTDDDTNKKNYQKFDKIRKLFCFAKIFESIFKKKKN